MKPLDVKHFRRDYDLSQRDLAELVGTRSARTVRRWEHSERDIPDSAAIIMAMIRQDEQRIDEIYSIRGELNLPPIVDANDEVVG